jgi:hypothetical protein
MCGEENKLVQYFGDGVGGIKEKNTWRGSVLKGGQ